MFARYLTLTLTLALCGCASGGSAPAELSSLVEGSPAETRCSNGDVSLSTDFPAGALASCTIDDENQINVILEPEDEPPINCSAWYAFRVDSQTAADMKIDLSYGACGHRYWPKYSHDGTTWTYFEPNSVKVTEVSGLKQARISLRSEGRPIYVAAQEIIVPSTYENWLISLEGHNAVTRFLLGQSLENRDIPAITIESPDHDQRKTVVLVGRQHPPEVTGALAMLPFVETLLGNSELAKTYRSKFRTVVVPMLNPDGVVRGHWRHNANSTDLNRDWGPFVQPETRLMRDVLEAIETNPNEQLVLFIDFHSTSKDVIYSLAKDLETNTPKFTDEWLADYQSRLPGYEVVEQPGHNPDLAVSKAWVYERFGVPTATYEIGDETDRNLIPRLGQAAAESMMATLLKYDKIQP